MAYHSKDRVHTPFHQGLCDHMADGPCRASRLRRFDFDRALGFAGVEHLDFIFVADSFARREREIVAVPGTPDGSVAQEAFTERSSLGAGRARSTACHFSVFTSATDFSSTDTA